MPTWASKLKVDDISVVGSGERGGGGGSSVGVAVGGGTVGEGLAVDSTVGAVVGIGVSSPPKCLRANQAAAMMATMHRKATIPPANNGQREGRRWGCDGAVGGDP